ncbi:MAG: hypothetical protein JXB49_17410 [Bacteroidales bacterium]|nr:hypothetical protein [Bacteroidales bacterium]MBN2862176.1 hypothetical protein [Bacteroidales bacterium]
MDLFNIKDRRLLKFTQNSDPIKDMRIGTTPPIEEWFKSGNCNLNEKIKIEKNRITIRTNIKLSSVPSKKFNYDTSVKIIGDLICDDLELENFNNWPKLEVQGNFSCSKTKLISLQGCPSVKGNFLCDNNRLTSLKGAPKNIKGSFSCCNNQLESLEGCPNTVGGNFWCDNNNLTSLKNAPKIIGGSFSCTNNPLQSIDGLPVVKGNCWIV